MNHLDINQIKEIIPHRHPFLLLDYIEDYVPGEYAVGYKCVSYREEFFAGHFPAAGKPAVGETWCGAWCGFVCRWRSVRTSGLDS